MKLAWSLGVKKLYVQSDSRTAVSILLAEGLATYQHIVLVLQFQELRSRQWNIKFTHVHREANYVVDYLVNLGHSLSFRLHFFLFRTLCFVLGLDTTSLK
ncbi:hypothetical protein LINPERPRIM_LOCUS40593 [Linum perenne]